ncbi:MAG: thioredoxin family protein [Actinobacteria bacterium]|nr:thioredoxin family protein [Actinomycetota bacterium]
MAERFLIALAIAAGVTGAVYLIKGWLAQRRRRTLRIDARAFATPGHATVLYFYTDLCDPCRSVQKPEIERLAQNTTNVIVRPIDAVASPDLARTFGVLTVPTTVVVGPEGRVMAVNYGVTRQAKLMEQIALV